VSWRLLLMKLANTEPVKLLLCTQIGTPVVIRPCSIAPATAGYEGASSAAVEVIHPPCPLARMALSHPDIRDGRDRENSSAGSGRSTFTRPARRSACRCSETAGRPMHSPAKSRRYARRREPHQDLSAARDERAAIRPHPRRCFAVVAGQGRLWILRS